MCAESIHIQVVNTSAGFVNELHSAKEFDATFVDEERKRASYADYACAPKRAGEVINSHRRICEERELVLAESSLSVLAIAFVKRNVHQ